MNHALCLTDFILLFSMPLIRTIKWSNRPEKYDFVFIGLSYS